MESKSESFLSFSYLNIHRWIKSLASSHPSILFSSVSESGMGAVFDSKLESELDQMHKFFKRPNAPGNNSVDSDLPAFLYTING